MISEAALQSASGFQKYCQRLKLHLWSIKKGGEGERWFSSAYAAALEKTKNCYPVL